MSKATSTRRIGFRDGRDLPERAGYVRSDEDVREAARWIFLQTIAQAAPEVLHSLAAVEGSWDETPDDLGPWARRWHLDADWCLAYARATWDFWRAHPAAGRGYWMPRSDLAGSLVPDTPPPSAPRKLKEPHHMLWLVQFHVLGLRFAEVLAASDVAVGDVQTCHEAVRALADLIDLPLRRATRGRPRKARPTS